MSEHSLEQRTENTRVVNSVITPVSMHPEGSDLLEAFLCPLVFVEGIFLFDILILVICKKDYAPSVAANYISSSVV